MAAKSSGPVPAMRSSKRPSTVALTRIPEMPSSLSKPGSGTVVVELALKGRVLARALGARSLSGR